MKIRIMKIFRLVCFFVFLINGISVYSQEVVLGQGLPMKGQDLVFSSTDKALLFNRVELVDRSSPEPLSSTDLTPGMLVYNTKITKELTEGFYFWSSSKKWFKLYNKTSPTRQMSLVKFKQTSSFYTLNWTTPVGITELDYDYYPVESGLAFLDYVVYVSTPLLNIKVATKTVLNVVVTDNNGSTVLNESIAIAAFVVIDKAGLNAVTGVGAFTFNVIKGNNYKIRLSARDEYTGTAKASTVVQVGDFEYGNRAHSSLKVTFLSEPVM